MNDGSKGCGEHASEAPSGRGSRTGLPKLCGADIELGNFVLGVERDRGTGAEASRALLRAVDGVPREREVQFTFAGTRGLDFGDHWSAAVGRAANPQEWGRKFLAGNGGSAYVDLDHLEICIPEVLSAFDHVAATHAMFRIARAALREANRQLPPGQQIQVLVNNSDGHGNSYGSHLSFLVTRRAWENIFRYRLHCQLLLASCQVSAIVLTGQGKVGAENDAPPVAFQISQRADFFETLSGVQTTYRRPLVNSRDESLCGFGESREMARLHCIFFDNSLCHVASLLRVGIMQLVLAMIEAEHVNPRLILEDPVLAVVRFSHDPRLRVRARLVSGERVTAVELQRLFFEEAERFVRAGRAEGIVPRAGEIIRIWDETLRMLEAADFGTLAHRLDWVLKLRTITRAMEKRRDLDWRSAEARHLDQLYASLDENEGLYWAYEAAGTVERVVDEDRVQHFVHHPAEDTRAWTRAMVLRAVDPDSVVHVDWDSIRIRRIENGAGPVEQRLDLGNPLVGRAEFEARLATGRSKGTGETPQTEERYEQ